MSAVLTVCMVVSLLAGMNLSFADEVLADTIGGNGVINGKGVTYDIFLNKDSKLPYNTNKLADQVGIELQKLIEGSESTKDQTWCINTSTQSIDTQDLSTWYVYDHYDTAHYTDQSAWEAVYGESSNQRPYQSYSETEGGERITIADKAKTDLTQWTTVSKLDSHIYSYEMDGKPAMLFAGYGSPDYCDYLFYPTTNTGRNCCL